MSDEILKKLKEVRSKEKERKFEKAVKMYKGLTLLFPEKDKYWYLLGVSLFKMGKNSDAFKALAVAKKLGNEKALEIISKVLIEFEKAQPDRACDARELLFGKEAKHA